MKKMIPFVLGSLLLLGATACTENPDTAATNGDGVRSNQIESDARARDQRERTNSDTATNATTNSEGVRSNQIESDARARDQRERTNSDTDTNATTNSEGVRNNQMESDTRARDQRNLTNSATDNGQKTRGDLAVDVRNSLESKLPGSRLAVDVDSNNGKATIDGTVQSQEQFEKIEPLVMAFDGIQSVDVKADVNSN